MKDLDYVKTRKDLEAALSTRPVWKDFNFSASGVSALLDVLAYTSHRMSFYAKMLMDESFVDTAHTLPAMLSHAKRLGHAARGKKAAVVSAVVTARIPLASPVGVNVVVPAGTRFKGANATSDTRVFTALEEFVLGEVAPTATQRVFTGTVVLHEGVMKSSHWVVGGEALNPLYTCHDLNADFTTAAITYRLPATLVDVAVPAARGPDDMAAAAFYAFRERLGTTKIVITEVLPVGTRVDAKWLSTTGKGGNGVSALVFTKGTPAFPADVNSFTDVSCVVTEASQGGAEAESVEELRVSIPESWRQQYRAVTPSDIAAIITSKYGDVGSVDVWGGEDEPRRRYGKTMICVTPKSSRLLSMAGRAEITRLLTPYKVGGDTLVFVDADEMRVDTRVVVRGDGTVTNTAALRAAAETVVAAALNTSSGEPVGGLSASRIAAALAEVDGVFSTYVEAVVATTLSYKTPVKTIDYGVPISSAQPPTGWTARIDGSVVTYTKTAVENWGGVATAKPAVPEFKTPRRFYMVAGKTTVEAV